MLWGRLQYQCHPASQFKSEEEPQYLFETIFLSCIFYEARTTRSGYTVKKKDYQIDILRVKQPVTESHVPAAVSKLTHIHTASRCTLFVC